MAVHDEVLGPRKAQGPVYPVSAIHHLPHGAEVIGNAINEEERNSIKRVLIPKRPERLRKFYFGAKRGEAPIIFLCQITSR